MSATSVGQIGLDLVLNSNDFKKQMSGVSSMAKKAGKALASAFAVKQVVNFGKACIDLGSDLQEVQNVVDVTFPGMSAQVNEFAQAAASSFGLSETMAKKYVGTFGSMAKAFGFTESQAYDMSTSLTGLAGDVASFYNLTQDEAYTKLKSVFTGETEALKDLGVVMTQTALDSYAMENGFGKTTSAMNEAEKVALRYAFVQDQLSTASGDFVRTSDGWANQIKVLKLQIESFKASIGQGLINILTPVVQVINTLTSKMLTLANVFKAFTELITGKSSSDGTSDSLNSTADAASNLADSTSAIEDSANSASKAMRSLAGFDEIQTLSDSSSSSSSSSGSSIDLGSLSTGEIAIAGLTEQVSSLFESMSEYVQPAADALERLKEALDPLSKSAMEGLRWLWEEALVPMGQWTIGEAVPEFLDALTNGLNALNGVVDLLKPALGWTWTNVLKPMQSWNLANAISFLDDLNDGLSVLSDICNIRSWEDVKKTLNNILDGIIQNFKDAYSRMKKAFSGTKSFYEGVWSNIKSAFSTAKTWFSDKFTACWTKVKDAFASSKIKTFFQGVWSNIKGCFSTVSSWFSSTFSAAWEKVKNVFSSGGKIFDGIKDGILNGLKTVINKLIQGINTVVKKPFEGLNTALTKLRNTTIMGTKPFANLSSISVPQIPMLAEGGYVKANTPQLAMIGDNRHQGEVVAPEDKLTEMALKAAKMAGGGNDRTNALLQQMVGLLTELLDDPNDTVLYIGDEEIARANKRGSARLNRRYSTTTAYVGG